MSDSVKNTRFQTVVLPHLNAAFNLAYWLTRNRQDAEDVVQEAYMRAFRFFDGFHGDDSRSWLLTIVRNTFYTWYRQNHTSLETATFDEEMHSSEALDATDVQRESNEPEGLLMKQDDARMLQHALESLPLEFREVIILRELEELSYKQIAGVVGIPVGTVMSRLARARKLLMQSVMVEKQERSWTMKKH